MATCYTDNPRDVYYYWTISTNNSGSTTTSSTDLVWDSWMSTTDSGGTTPYDATWSYWMEDSTDNRIHKSEIQRFDSIVIPTVPVVLPSAEEKRAKAAQREINKIWGDIRIMEEHRRKERAEVTAQSLLLDLIGKEELERYKGSGYLLVKGRKFDYVIQKGRGVYKVEKEKVIDLCVHFRNRYKYPETDNLIGLKLLIEADESKFLRIANSHGVIHNEHTKKTVLDVVDKAA